MLLVSRDPESYRRAELEELARAAATRYGLPPDGYVAQIGRESGWAWDAVSPAGAFGLAQFMPLTAEEWGVDVADPVSSLDGGARYMAWLRDQLGDLALALAAYNWGIGNVRRYLRGERNPPDETRNYVAALAPAYGVSDPFTPKSTGSGAVLLLALVALLVLR